MARGGAGVRLKAGLTAWVRRCPRPLVLFFDEIDALRGDGLLTVLRQLRAGFTQDRDQFVHSVVLCGLRDVRDYKAAFNTKIASLRLGDFSRVEVGELYGHHTRETGQECTEQAIDLAYSYTQGQPWLVNAMAWEIVGEMRMRDTITAEHVELAKERIILARATHLDSLIDKLTDPRVVRIIEPIIAGSTFAPVPEFDDDVSYTRDLGLIGARPLTKRAIHSK